MKLAEHVHHLRTLINNAFKKQFSRLGFGANKQFDIDQIPSEFQGDRQRFEELLYSHIEETGSYQEAREKLVDELTFTLFNRIAAVKVMESAQLFPPIITKAPEHGNRSFGHKAWLEIRPDMRSEDLEGIREYIQHAFNELGDTLPLYCKNYPYAMLPDPISLNEIIEAFNAVDEDPNVDEDIWESDDVLGWLYESYNNEKKEEFKDSGKKTEYDKVYLQSQVYTPRWVVKFLIDNSLGKLYLEMYPDSEIIEEYKIANAPETKIREPKPLPDIKLIDPACGSGNFLLYAFDLLYALYEDQIENYGAGFEKEEIPRLIIEQNLHGIDIDDRATQLAQLGLYIKARKKHKDIGELQYQVVSSAFFLPDYGEVKHIFEANTSLDKHQKALIAEVWGDLQNAYKFGSLIRLDEKLKARLRELVSKREEKQEEMFTDEELGIKPKPVQPDLFLEQDIEREKQFAEIFFENLKAAVRKYARVEGSSFLTSKTKDAIFFLELLTSDYQIAVTNPPYTDDRDMGPDLKRFLNLNYKEPEKFNTNLYASFLKRCYDFGSGNGYIALIHPPTFMYIKSFEDVREFIIEKTHIDLFVEWGYLGLFNPSVRVDSAFYILKLNNLVEDKSVFIKVNQLYETKRRGKLFEAYKKVINDESHKLLFILDQSKLKQIERWPFIYWISDDFRMKFELPALSEYYDICNGISSGGNNERFYRYWWEINSEKILDGTNFDTYKWATINKGGDYQKWYGNLWIVFKWENNGHELKSLKSEFPSIRYSYEKYYFEEGLAFSGSTSKGLSVRYQPPNCLFERSGKSIFSKKGKTQKYYYLLALLNSKIVFYMAECLNPTVSIQTGDIKRIPFTLPNSYSLGVIEKLSKDNVSITKKIKSYKLPEKNFSNSPLQTAHREGFKKTIKNFLCFENRLATLVLINEAIINNEIFNTYDLAEQDIKMIKNSEGESVGNLPVCKEAQKAYLSVSEATPENFSKHTHEFVETLPIKKFEIEKKKAIERDFSSLYQKNVNFEKFCIKHQANPINIWYWFTNSKNIPEHRMHTLAMEFLAILIGEALKDDEDGIIPLVHNAGEESLLGRLEKKFYEKKFSAAQFSDLEKILRKPLRIYLNQHFFADISDRLNIFPNFPKTPYIWHLTSGPERGFECYLIIYKWSRDNLMRIRSVYIEQRERALINRQSDLNGNESAEAQHERDKIYNQLQEIKVFKEKIDELLAEGYDPVLDDGVGKNIAPLQEKGMLPYDVLTDSQLKTYLNADW